MHERHDDSSNFSRENHEQSREGARHSGEYRRDRAPPSYSSAGNQLLRCVICGTVSTRVAAENRRPRWYCTGGHIGQWQSVVIIPSFYGTNNWIQTCPITVGVHNTTKIVTSHVNVSTVLTWRLCQCIPSVARQVELLPCMLLTFLRHESDYSHSSSRL